MAALTINLMSTAGLDPSFEEATAAGDTFVNNGRTFIAVANGSGGSINVTFDSQTACSQGTDHDVVVAVPDGDTIRIGPFPMDRFNNSAGSVELTYSDDTSVTVAVISL